MKTSEGLKAIADLLNECLSIWNNTNASNQLYDLLSKAYSQALHEKVQYEQGEVNENISHSKHNREVEK